MARALLLFLWLGLPGCDDGAPLPRPKVDAGRDGGQAGGGKCPADGPVDEDGDGHGAPCEDEDGVQRGDDCDDNDPLRFPGNVEVCDGERRDEDCDESTFGELDRDADGFVDSRCCNLESEHCGDDCYDLRADVHPGAEELCDGFDNDCDGETDEGVHVMRYLDLDFDGHGEIGGELHPVCEETPGYSEVDDDCNDMDATVHPGMHELCDNIDNDCDGAPEAEGEATEGLWYLDGDDDGYGIYTEAAISCTPPPLALICNVEVGRFACFAGKSVVPEANMSAHHRDGELTYRPSPLDCQDADAATHPGAVELCDGVDNDCNGRIDYRLGVNDFEDDDGDKRLDAVCERGDDCDDMDPTIGPRFEEVCDHFDNDCDGKIDEGVESSEWYLDRDGDGYGDASAEPIESCGFVVGRAPVGGDCNDEDPVLHPDVRELCNAIDDDCDGVVDEIVVGCRDVVSVSGRVSSRLDGSAVAGAHVEAYDDVGVAFGSTTTGADGSFSLEAPEGIVVLSVLPADGNLVGVTQALLAPVANLQVRLDPHARWHEHASDLGISWDSSLGLVVLQLDGVAPTGGQGTRISPDAGRTVTRLGGMTVDGGFLPSFTPPVAPGTAGAPFAEVTIADVPPGAHALPLSNAGINNRLGVPNCTLVAVDDVGDPALQSGPKLTVNQWPVHAGTVTLLRVDCSLGIANCCAAHGHRGCRQTEIEACVCAQKPACCEAGGWDASCVELVSSAGCSSCPAVVPEGGFCCDARDAIGCGNEDIEACVCALKPECCQGLWSDDCAGSVFPLRCAICPLRLADGGTFDPDADAGTD